MSYVLFEPKTLVEYYYYKFYVGLIKRPNFKLVLYRNLSAPSQLEQWWRQLE